MTSKHVPPSRKRFELSHPTVTTRVDRELHLALTDIAESEAKSLGEVVRDALNAYVESALSAEQPDGEQPAALATTDPAPESATATDKAPVDPYMGY